MNIFLCTNKKNASILVSIIAFFTIFFIFCGFAIDFSMTISARLQLQNAVETAALNAVKNINSGTAEITARNIFSYSKANLIKTSRISNITIKNPQKAILVEATAQAQPYFLSALGINNIQIQAQSAAQLIPQILQPDTDFNIINHLQYTYPTLIFSNPGNEIKITRGDTTGEYSVYIGLNNKLDQTRWIEITCSSDDKTAKEQEFDFNKVCEQNNGDISAAKFIRIVNKNSSTPLEVDELMLLNIAKLISRSSFNAL